jgi:hypothetical protein
MGDSEELHLEQHVDYIKSLDKVGFASRGLLALMLGFGVIVGLRLGDVDRV